MNILILGATGFIGKNLVSHFSSKHFVFVAKLTDEEAFLLDKIKKADVIINASGVSRSTSENDFFLYNMYYSQKLFTLVNNFENKMYLYFSSIHYYVDTIYGVSKRYNEFLLNSLGYDKKNYFLCLRIPSIFGSGMKPNYVSVVATFCNNIANNKPSSIVDGEKVLQLLYIEDLVNTIILKAENKKNVGYELYENFSEVKEISVNDLYKSITEIANETENVTSDFLLNLTKTYEFFSK